MLSNKTLNYILNEMEKEIKANSDIIQKDRLAEILDDFNYGEYEMTFEYLFLELMETEGSKFTMGRKTALKIAKLLERDKEYFYDKDFWQKLQDFVDEREPIKTA